VGSINKSHLDELRSLMMPPEAIHDVMNGVLRMFGNFDGSWNNVKKFLKNRSVIDNILDFDPKMITPEIRKDMEKFLHDKSNSFEKNVIYRSSLAAGPLADWVKAILKYSVVLEKINPLEDDLNKVKKKLDSQKSRVVECEDQLKELGVRVVKLKDEFSKKTSEAEILKNDLRRAEENLGLAQSLLDKLSDEKGRWQGQVNSIEKQVKSLPYDCLLSSGQIIV
jgi:dynein heavy chain 2